MKTLLTFFILISNLTLFAQENKVAGDYAFTPESKDGNRIEYKLTLNQDGTFECYYHKYIKEGIPPDTHHYGKGTWKIKDNLVSFFSDKQKDIDEKHTMNFTNSVARFVTKSPRDKSDKIIKIKLQFLESDIFWIKPIGLFKIE
ncbi:hypothetical protein GON26_00490 [Flavobacterium sp. GA093]|uniref:Copper resistance protein NlpE n=1 Tax=Flavobacterium hydrocarbonoxydans TaxID=2683249 RepID=A0A6I4NFZ7_9FLAO|nr:hypothetical protein [Flavobacterium hydrocarbonoxydans]MWB92833.1 hypothetical protein [Flavobacterium hydrocarbonoxydans]